jgi:hypothetical protein
MLASPVDYDDNSDCDNQRTREKFMLNRAAIILKYKEPAIGDKAVDRWLRANYENLFEAELEGWYTDPSPAAGSCARVKLWITAFTLARYMP